MLCVALQVPATPDAKWLPDQMRKLAVHYPHAVSENDHQKQQFG
jgi:hypothetical protein